jgi:hypothetical protein
VAAENPPAAGGISLRSVREARERLEQDGSQESPSEDAQQRDDEVRQARDELRRLRDDG